ncbi:hypothetical protein TSOC_003673, partial [Tetrabaena socialis]
ASAPTPTDQQRALARACTGLPSGSHVILDGVEVVCAGSNTQSGADAPAAAKSGGTKMVAVAAGAGSVGLLVGVLVAAVVLVRRRRKQQKKKLAVVVEEEVVFDEPVAIMFSLYELAGVVTNLAAGMMGAKWGIKWTLLAGLSLQLVGISVLYGWQDSWSRPETRWKGILFVTCAQMLCGVAKDLTKLGGKTVTKLVTPDEQQSNLFKLVSFITGFKNSLKGIGYFIGAATIAFNYYFALGLLLLLILAAMPWAAVGLSSQLGRARKENLTLARIFKQPYNINVLSVSRYFLFGSRDMWFEVPLPFFLRNVAYGLGWSRPLTGLFLAVWIIVYGQVQSWTPQLVLSPLKQAPANK